MSRDKIASLVKTDTGQEFYACDFNDLIELENILIDGMQPRHNKNKRYTLKAKQLGLSRIPSLNK